MGLSGDSGCRSVNYEEVSLRWWKICIRGKKGGGRGTNKQLLLQCELQFVNLMLADIITRVPATPLYSLLWTEATLSSGHRSRLTSVKQTEEANYSCAPLHSPPIITGYCSTATGSRRGRSRNSSKFLASPPQSTCHRTEPTEEGTQCKIAIGGNKSLWKCPQKQMGTHSIEFGAK